MKNYLSRDERRIATYFCICYGLIDSQMEYKQNYSKDEITALRYVNTYLQKYIDALIKRVGKEEGERILRDATQNTVDLHPKNYDGQYIVDREALEGALTYAVEYKCKNCNKTDYYHCDLYKCMDKCGMSTVGNKAKYCDFAWQDKEAK